MPIVIQELVASDSISQAVDKINFNFDQLILNGGGPPGPTGQPGPTGPVGGRGIKGATWYKDNTPSPGVDPNTIIIAGLAEDDYYLQGNGQVWQYNGTIWVQSVINLTGPQGTPGSSIGFNYAGGFPGTASINNQNVAYIVPMPDGIGSGANQLTNQGVSVMLMGAVASNVIPPAGISYTSAFQLPDVITKTMDSSFLSVLVHQKDSNSSSIRFMGGGEIMSDKYEQLNLANLSNITLGIDDSFNINVPKAATLPIFASDLIGFNLNTIRKGQQFRAGKQINLISGTDNSVSLAGEISDIVLTVNTSNPTNPGKFTASTTETASTALFEIGGRINVPNSTSKTGKILGEGNEISLVGNSITLRNSTLNFINVSPVDINVQAGTGAVNLITTNSQPINVLSNGLILAQSPSNVTIENTTTGGFITLKSNTINLSGIGTNHAILIDNTSTTLGGTKIKGNITWAATSQITPLVTSHRNISILKTGLSNNVPTVYIGDTNTGLTAGRNLMLAAFKGTTYGTAIEYTRIHTASTEIKNTAGNAGYVGHTVENTSISMAPGNVGFKLSGVDRSGGNQAPNVKFHAQEDTTTVYNRMHYARKILNINPLTEGIPQNGDYTIPETLMDTSYLDIYVGWNGITLPDSLNNSGNSFNIIIPNGKYPGQRLCIHIVAAPTRARDNDSGLLVSWPASPEFAPVDQLDVEGYAGVTLKTASWQSPTLPNNNVLIQLNVSAPTANPLLGDEGYVELVWIGQEYIQAEQTDIGGPIKLTSAFRGWIAVNGAEAERIGTLGQLNKGSFSTNARMRFTT
jgi:hypothetical protein